jgi:Glycosyl hydrolase family 12
MATVLSGNYATDIPATGSYTLDNSTWNVGNLVNGRDFTETITVDDPNTPNMNTTFSWNFPNVPAGGNVYSFPAIHYGQDYSMTAATHITPEQVNNIKTLTVSSNISLSGQTDQYDAIVDGFLTSTPNGGLESANTEFEIYLHTPTTTKGWIGGLPQHTFTDSQGIQWIIAGGGGSAGKQIAFAPANFQDLTNVTVDLKALLQAAVADGVISGTDYFNGLAFGNEPREGTGSMTVHSFQVNYDGDPNFKGATGGTQAANPPATDPGHTADPGTGTTTTPVNTGGTTNNGGGTTTATDGGGTMPGNGGGNTTANHGGTTTATDGGGTTTTTNGGGTTTATDGGTQAADHGGGTQTATDGGTQTTNNGGGTQTATNGGTQTTDNGGGTQTATDGGTQTTNNGGGTQTAGNGGHTAAHGGIGHGGGGDHNHSHHDSNGGGNMHNVAHDIVALLQAMQHNNTTAANNAMTALGNDVHTAMDTGNSSGVAHHQIESFGHHHFEHMWG